jgi:hypothetical protein
VTPKNLSYISSQHLTFFQVFRLLSVGLKMLRITHIRDHTKHKAEKYFIRLYDK